MLPTAIASRVAARMPRTMPTAQLTKRTLLDGPRGPEGVPLDRRAYVYGACFTGIILYSLPREYVTYKQSEMYVKPHEEKGWLEG